MGDEKHIKLDIPFEYHNELFSRTIFTGWLVSKVSKDGILLVAGIALFIGGTPFSKLAATISLVALFIANCLSEILCRKIITGKAASDTGIAFVHYSAVAFIVVAVLLNYFKL
jgi:hypothetical protein